MTDLGRVCGGKPGRPNYKRWSNEANGFEWVARPWPQDIPFNSTCCPGCADCSPPPGQEARACAKELVEQIIWMDEAVPKVPGQVEERIARAIDLAVERTIKANTRIADERSAARIHTLEETFCHYHIAHYITVGDQDRLTSQCGECGLDVRDPVHVTLDPDARKALSEKEKP